MPLRTETKQQTLQKSRVASGLEMLSREKAELASLAADNMRQWKRQVKLCYDAGWTRPEIATMVEEYTGESCSMPWIAAVLAEVRQWDNA